MALKELPSALRRLAVDGTRPSTSFVRNCRRYASTEAATKNVSQDLEDLEPRSSYSPISVADEEVGTYDPVKRVQQRRRQLPPSRYECPFITLGLQRLTYVSDTSINHQDISVDHFILISLPRHQIQPLENMSQDHSAILD